MLVDFWAPWCGPCKQLTPTLEKVVKAAKGKVKLVKMNIEEHPSIAGQMGIQSIPAVIAFVDGRPADGFLGALPEAQVVAFLERITKGSVGDRDQGRHQGGRYGAGRGRCRRRRRPLRGGAGRGPDQCLRAGRPGPRLCGDRRAGAGQADAGDGAGGPAKRHLGGGRPCGHRTRRPGGSLGPLAELEQKVAANPLDHQARYDLALALNAANRRGEAIDHLMEIVRRDRKWNDDGARRQLVQLFDAWGPTDEATIAGRKRLSSILFA